MLEKKDFLITTETTPDVSTDLSGSSKKIEPLLGLADAVNVTDSPNCKTRLNSLLVASEIKKSGLDVILQLILYKSLHQFLQDYRCILIY